MNINLKFSFKLSVIIVSYNLSLKINLSFKLPMTINLSFKLSMNINLFHKLSMITNVSFKLSVITNISVWRRSRSGGSGGLLRAASGGQCAGEEEDAEHQLRLRGTPSTHPHLPLRAETLQDRHSATGHRLHWVTTG